MTSPTAGRRQAVLFVYRPGRTLKQRLEKDAYPFSLCIVDRVDALPELWPVHAALLVFVPEERELLSRLAASAAVLACGPISEIERAFRLGAADFLARPLLAEELKARVSRLLDSNRRRFFSFELSGFTLWGKKGRVILGLEERRLLETLLHNRGRAVSRTALRDMLWPDLDPATRMPDMAVSRLRKRFKKAGASDGLIQTVRGFGYLLQNE
ncbi:MAG: winged helix-turn-helix domain-containing protein [Spirochaetaceae bacterium]|jgi:DNA-binding response OmpR family regulator|nr:winged helix-turn-helix domain-containing protein [Spirochaetaceae bacterium]